MKLPTFNQAWHKQNSERNPLEDFIVGFQPSRSNSPQWREDLQAAIDFVLAQKVGELNKPVCICNFDKNGMRKLSLYPYLTDEHLINCPCAHNRVYAKKAPKKIIPKLDLSRYINVLDEYGMDSTFSRLAVINALREIQDAYNKSL